jgi:hypothetical protein
MAMNVRAMLAILNHFWSYGDACDLESTMAMDARAMLAIQNLFELWR